MFRDSLMRTVGRLLVAVLLVVVVLSLESSVTMSLRRGDNAVSAGTWSGVLISSTAGLAVSLLLITAFSRGRIRSWGFRVAAGRSLAPGAVAGLGIGIAGSLVARVIPGQTPDLFAGLSFLQIVVLVWLYRSLCEEVLFRGLVQSFLAPLAERGVIIRHRRVSLPVLVSALLFALMHFALLTVGFPFLQVLPVVLFAGGLGLVAGHYREQTGSLIPAIVVHVSGNAGGHLAGLLLGVSP